MLEIIYTAQLTQQLMRNKFLNQTTLKDILHIIKTFSWAIGEKLGDYKYCR